MTISATIYIEHPDIALTDTINAVPDADLRVVSEAGTDPESESYFYAVERENFDAVDDALAVDHTVADAAVVSELGGQRIYRVEYATEAKLVTPKITEVGGITLEAKARDDGWELHLQLPDRRALNDLWEFANEEDIRLTIVELYGDAERQAGSFGLTDPQKEALIAAFMHGYFEEPRTTSLEDLAELLDISPTAVGGRLRRGMKQLVGAALVENEES